MANKRRAATGRSTSGKKAKTAIAEGIAADNCGWDYMEEHDALAR